MLTQIVLCVVNVRFFYSAHELLLACVLAVFLCICVLVLIHDLLFLPISTIESGVS